MTRPLTIAVVAACPFPYPRGTPIRICRESEALAQRGHRVHVVCYHIGRGEVSSGIKVHRVKAPSWFGKELPGPSIGKLAVLDPLLSGALRRLLRQEPIDVIHAHHYEGLLVALAARGRRHNPPIVFDAHTLLTSELPTYRLGLPSGFLRTVAMALDRRVPARADHIVTVTPKIRDRLVGELGLPSSRVTVVENGVEIEEFSRVPEPVAVPGKVPGRVLFTGNLVPYQRVDLLLEAFAQVVRRRPATRLILAVDGTFNGYEEAARRLGIRDDIDILPMPPFANLPDLMATADVAVNPRTDCDGMPVKLLNYMAAARPVVSFAGAAPGVVHGGTGWIAPDADVDRFAEGILHLLEEPALAAKLGHAARLHVETNYRWSKRAEELEHVFARVTGQQAP